MRAALFTGPGEPISYVDLPDPQAPPGWVVLDVRAAGMCHSDVHTVRGPGAAWLSRMPIVLGHEVAGTVAALGAGVTGFALGDRVGVCSTPGPDEHTRPFGPGTHLGPAGGSQPGTHVDGGYAQQCVVRASRLVPIPPEVSFEQAAIGTDALAAGYHNVRNVAGVRIGERVGIVGLGGLGMAGLRTAVLAGAHVYGVDVREEVFDDARADGALDCFTDIAALAELDLDVIVDFANAAGSVNAAVRAVRPRGRVVVVGLGSEQIVLDTIPLVLGRRTLLTSQGIRKQDLEDVYGLLARGLLSPRLEAFDFDRIPEALERLARGNVHGRLFTRPPTRES
ncbi:alcohol dehydrogenase catalytic domain-containing protein [Nocardioides sp. LHD-245]|uniref:alcohol dehydrogenase catalytic domain-containing protein n=1 Tax=Nocardioides sp. LHD-245 TaxID=3051387 RepID=UPI0027DF7465|nr:alcohol dehydrogenase catalytic domain-containing protein [Nocardioides sp. LHD-245]